MPSVEVNGIKVNYREAGEGPLVILLHCSCSHSGQWKPLMDRLRDRFTLIAPDFHGYGKSGALPQDNQPYFRHDGAIVAKLMQGAEGPVHLVGHSLGGTIAARIALEHSEAIASVTLIEPVFFNLLEEKGDPRRYDYLQLAHDMIVLNRFGEDKSAAQLFVDFWGGPGAFANLDDQIRAYVVKTIGRVADDWFGISAQAAGALKAADFSKFAWPTLLMCARHTRPSARAIVEVLLGAIPDVEYQEIPDAGHMSPVTHPDVVNRAIIGFLECQT